MDKRKQARQMVRGRIVEALLDLIAEKPYSEITVTEIVHRAGVARQSYYRNFSGKEEVIEEFFEELRREGVELLRKEQPVDAQQWVTLILGLQKSRGKGILCLHRAGLSNLCIGIINRFAEEIIGDMPASSVEKYKIYCYSGMVFNVSLTWLLAGAKESPEELARIICNFRADEVLNVLALPNLLYELD